MDETKPQLVVTTRLTGDIVGRTVSAAETLFHGNEAMLAKEALTVYLDLRDALGYDFDRIVKPLRKRETAVTQ